jgi:hypothetical protein
LEKMMEMESEEDTVTPAKPAAAKKTTTKK